MRLAIISVALALAACQPQPQQQAKAVAAKLTEPRVTDYPTQYGRMLVIDVPLSGLGRSTEYQTCFVWKSADGSAMQCPNDRSSFTIDPPEN